MKKWIALLLTAAQAAAEAVGLRLTSVEVTEDTGNLPPVDDGLLYKTVVFGSVGPNGTN